LFDGLNVITQLNLADEQTSRFQQSKQHQSRRDNLIKGADQDAFPFGNRAESRIKKRALTDGAPKQ